MGLKMAFLRLFRIVIKKNNRNMKKNPLPMWRSSAKLCRDNEMKTPFHADCFIGL